MLELLDTAKWLSYCILHLLDNKLPILRDEHVIEFNLKY